MELQRLDGEFTVCQIEQIKQIDFTGEFVFLSKTDDEISLLCKSAHIPLGVTASEANWKGLKICGTLDFGMIGVIANIADILKKANISIFVVSTYNTDYIFVKSHNFDKSIQALTHHGYAIR